MKIVLTEKELLSGGNITNKSAIGVADVEALMDMECGTYDVGEVLSVLKIDEGYVNTINKQMPGILSVTKTETEYIFEVSEEFVLDTCGLISSGIVELFDGLKYVMKGMYAFYSMKVMPFKNKWTEIIAKNGGKSDDTPTKCK